MKKLPLKTPAYKYLESSFREWLDILGYAPSTVRAFPTHVREFLYWMEQQGQTNIHKIDIPQIKAYYKQLSQRPNQRLGGGLSNSYLNVHLNALDKLLDYLRKQARIEIPPTGIPQETPNPEPVQPLTTKQIHQLYEAITIYEEEHPVLALRDHAILAVFYDCGLRRNEGVSLDVSDVHYDNRLLEVRTAKGGQPRFVPFSKTTSECLQNYRYESRPHLIKERERTSAFFIGMRGNRMNGNSLNVRLKHIQQQTNDPILQQQPLHLHTLRHSIATHLLYQGMELEKVARFLGHRSLESTQIYTHLVDEALAKSTL